jgi:hypothetical protein
VQQKCITVVVLLLLVQRRLKERLGPAWGPLLGLESGHYAVDLTQPLHHLAVERILAVDNTHNEDRRA